MGVCVCVHVCVCVCVRACACVICVYTCTMYILTYIMCVSVCEKEREREGQRGDWGVLRAVIHNRRPAQPWITRGEIMADLAPASDGLGYGAQSHEVPSPSPPCIPHYPCYSCIHRAITHAYAV